MITVNTIGFDDFEAKVKGLPVQVLEEIDIETADAAALWEQLAKESAPRRFGFLANSISNVKIAPNNYEVVSPKFYSPYQEWGTGTFVDVPPDLAAYALQFKGEKSVKGIPPHPYFFIHAQEVNDFWVKNIERILTTEH